MPHKPLPVAPKIQPELPVRACRWPCGRMRRETFLTLSSIDALFANTMARFVLDPDPVRETCASPQLKMRYGQPSSTGFLTAACIRRRLANH